MRRAAHGVIAALLLAACAPTPSPPQAAPDDGLAGYLPSLADYPWTGWNVVQLVGAPGETDPPPARTAEPAGCEQAPFTEPGRIAARTVARHTSLGPTGYGGEASVVLFDPQASRDLIAQTRAWARRCAVYVEWYSGEDRGPGMPTSVSVLPARRIAGVDVLRVLFTDNREQRFQAEGSRESVVYLARVGDVVVGGRRHDSGPVLDDVFGVTLRRLTAHRRAPRPLADTAGTADLRGYSDADLSRLLPVAGDLPAGWTVGHTSPTVAARIDDYGPEGSTDPRDCATIPFMNERAPRADVGHDFREVATAEARSDATGGLPGGLDHWQSEARQVRLNIEDPTVDVIEATKRWAQQCATYRGVGRQPTEGSVDLVPTTVAGHEAYAVRLTRSLPTNFDFWTILTRVRGVLVTALSPSDEPGELVRATVEHLRDASFDTAPAPLDYHPYPGPSPIIFDHPPGEMPLREPSAEEARKLADVAHGAIVDAERYHVGGYLPGDPTTRTPDYLHFRSPTGSIVCTWRTYSLFCDVPAGTYPKTPKPRDHEDDWNASVVNFGWERVVNGVVAEEPVVYAESEVLPYGSTIRLEDDPDATACRMERDGLTCVVGGTRPVGMHLSRDDLTPLRVTGESQPR
ncbi:MAG TPA: hypothetical protein VK069_11990 [Mycolicibacillus parakoreensis]|nr:hypothetical protein [Mycolicibacillus parakoreensis]